MAHFCGEDCSDFTMFKKLQTCFKQLGAAMVLDMSVFTAISLELSYQEFKQRYLRVHGADNMKAEEEGAKEGLASNEITAATDTRSVVQEESK